MLVIQFYNQPNKMLIVDLNHEEVREIIEKSVKSLPISGCYPEHDTDRAQTHWVAEPSAITAIIAWCAVALRGCSEVAL